MRSRTLAWLWLIIGLLLWCGVFDQVIARGADNYLRLHAEWELHLIDREPSMSGMMSEAAHHGIALATGWAGTVVGFGWATIWLRGGSRWRGARGSL